MELLSSQTIVLQYGIGKLECRIHENPVISAQHFGIHRAHRCTYDQVRLFRLTKFFKHIHGLDRLYGDVRGNDFC